MDARSSTLVEGSTQTKLFTNGDQGWVSTNTLNIGGPGSINTSYLAGYTSNSFFNDYFAFNLKDVSSSFKVTSATLTVYSGIVTSNLQYSLFGATNWLSEIAMGSPNATLYQEMVTGTPYGSFLIHENRTKPTSGPRIHPQRVGDRRHQQRDRGSSRVRDRWPCSLGAGGLDLDHDACRLRRTGRRGAPPGGQTQGGSLGRMRGRSGLA